MRRVLLCLITLAAAFQTVSAQSPKPRVPSPMRLTFQRDPPSGQQQQQQQTDNPCNATIPTGYPTLTAVPRTDTYVEYAGTLLTWTPNDNTTECHIRQIYFNVPDVMDNGTCTGENGVSPDIDVQLFLHGTNQAVKIAQNYDIVSQKNGPFILYRIDVQAPKELKGDYDFQISIVGHPKPAPAAK
jgi:hypothetical protein